MNLSRFDPDRAFNQSQFIEAERQGKQWMKFKNDIYKIHGREIIVRYSIVIHINFHLQLIRTLLHDHLVQFIDSSERLRARHSFLQLIC